VPFNVNRNHWVFAALWMKKKIAEYWDSGKPDAEAESRMVRRPLLFALPSVFLHLTKRQQRKMVTFLCKDAALRSIEDRRTAFKAAGKAEKEWTFAVRADCHRQRDSDSCGVFVLMVRLPSSPSRSCSLLLDPLAAHHLFGAAPRWVSLLTSPLIPDHAQVMNLEPTSFSAQPGLQLLREKLALALLAKRLGPPPPELQRAE